MKIALCHTSVLPRRGGCETYIASLSRRLVADGHDVHLFAGEWDAEALPSRMTMHKVALPPLPRFARPWWFSRACRSQIDKVGVDVSVGFDKIAGVDVYYPQGGMYEASVAMNDLVFREVDVLGSLAYCDDPPATIAMVRDGKVDPYQFITGRIDLGDIVEQGFRQLVDNKEENVKILVHP